MAGFPPDVEGGEFWLPPGLFPEEMYRLRTRPTAKSEGHFASELTASMEELAHRLAYAILDETHHRSPQLTPIFSPLPQTSSLRSSHGCRRFEHPASHLCCCRQKPVQASAVKPSLGATQILLKLSHNQPLLMSRIRSQNRGLPFRVVGSGARGFIRESGGTGVFLPRVAYNDAASMRRRPKMMSIEEEPSPLTNEGFGNGIIDLKTPSVVGSPPQPSEIVLPSEWTY